MDQATTFSLLMDRLWDSNMEVEPIIHALASHVKTHQRVNPEDALDVLNIFWPTAHLNARLPERRLDGDDDSVVIYDILFEDKSRALAVTRRGIASELELTDSSPLPRKCPECGHAFRGNGWDGIDAHWRANHEAVMPYEKAWPLIRDGQYPELARII